MILEGIRVIEWGNFGVAPYAATFLGDLGAEVIKLEAPGKGDNLRGMVRNFGQPMMLAGGKHAEFELINRNKKSLAVDLKKHKGREVIYQLVEKSDVFVTNIRRKTVERLGLNYSTLRQYNSRLIYAISSSVGSKGPAKDAPLFDMLGMARSGMLLASGEEGMVPVSPTPASADTNAGLVLSYSVLAGLLARERKGIGQYIEMSHLGSQVALQAWVIGLYGLGIKIPRMKRAEALNPVYNYYRCCDGKWIAIGCLQENQWPPLCQALGLSELEKDTRFEDMNKRTENNMELVHILDEFFSGKSRAEWEEILQGADVPFAPVNDISDVVVDPHVIENNYIEEFEHPVLGKMRMPGVGFNIKFSETPAAIRYCAPEVGEHTEEILQEVLGYSWDDIVKLRDEGVY